MKIFNSQSGLKEEFKPIEKGKINIGEMAEWFKAHAWKVCVPLQVPWVRIPLSPPF